MRKIVFLLLAGISFVLAGCSGGADVVTTSDRSVFQENSFEYTSRNAPTVVKQLLEERLGVDGLDFKLLTSRDGCVQASKALEVCIDVGSTDFIDRLFEGLDTATPWRCVDAKVWAIYKGHRYDFSDDAVCQTRYHSWYLPKIWLSILESQRAFYQYQILVAPDVYRSDSVRYALAKIEKERAVLKERHLRMQVDPSFLDVFPHLVLFKKMPEVYRPAVVLLLNGWNLVQGNGVYIRRVGDVQELKEPTVLYNGAQPFKVMGFMSIVVGTLGNNEQWKGHALITEDGQVMVLKSFRFSD